MMYREPDPHADAIVIDASHLLPRDSDWAATSAPLPFEDAKPQGIEAVRAACRAWGGLIEGETLARMLQERHAGDFSLLAKAIVSRQLIALEHGHRLWIPAFQFDESLAVRSRVRRIVMELKDVFEPAALALWFVERNDWLRQRRPIELIDAQFGEVWNAACADRFVASGSEA